MNKPMTLGQFIRKFCNTHSIKVKTFINDTGFKVYPLEGEKKIRLATYFKLAEYMSSHSGLPIEFYLKRLKQVLERRYVWRD